jgi:transcriptional regulator with XRE-family HTH domain
MRLEEGPLMPLRAALGAVVKARRLELGWTQEELAERISAEGEFVRQSEISRIESGKISLPRRDRLERLADALGLPLGELLARSGWAGAESSFQPSADSRVSEPQPAFHDGSPDVTIQLGEPLSTSGEVRRPMITRPAGTRDFNPEELADLRRALARMREESDRLQHNRLTALHLQRQFHGVSDHEPERPTSQVYSVRAGG